jgi:hypothetical protein
MTTTDIDPTAPSEERRYTAHIFKPGVPHYLGDPRVSSGSPLRVPDTTDRWPPDILFDIVYAGAILHHFSTRALKDELSESWKDTFYPPWVMTASHADRKAIIDKRAAAHEARRSPDVFDMLMILPYVKVPRSQLEAVHSEARKKKEEMEHERVKEKVDAWAKQVASESSEAQVPKPGDR